jgi:HEAT repeats
MKLAVVLLFTFALSMLAQPAANQQSTEEIIERLRKNPGEPRLAHILAERSSDPRVIPALRELFVQAKLSGSKDAVGYPASRELACALIAAGIKDDQYFDEVATYAWEAIADDPPLPFLTDSDGKEETTKRNPAFEKWCAIRTIEFDECARRMFDHFWAIGILGGIRDARALPILREALKASNFVLVKAAVAGLGALNDKDSIPLIAKVCARFPPLQAKLIAFSAMEFSDPGVQLLFDSFIKDPETLESVKKEWQEKHAKGPAQSGTPEKP